MPYRLTGPPDAPMWPAPATGNWYVFGQKPPVLGRHTGYWGDPAVWDVVEAYAKDLPVPTVPPPPGTRLAPDRYA
ncbi:MAG: hypothetical protein AUI14_12835 [Actinobacteria bacterium 13_2_20CM_2_71_6]|nr:MAG: hypothetical protein AUI14_12835 [Actinobacteria bacterium 13_2_20CM_2_71_6]